MKVFQINSTLNWGSTGKIVEEIGKVVIANSGESYIAYGRYANKSISHTIKIGNNIENVYSHVFQSRLLDNHGLSSRHATQNFIKQIKYIAPDIIHLHNIHGYYLNYQILFDYLARTSIPVVWTLHDCWAFTGHCAYYTYVKCNRRLVGCGNCPNIHSYPKSYFRDRSAQNYIDKKHSFTSVLHMTLVPVSNWLATEVKDSFLKSYPLQVIHNGINTDVFAPVNPKKKMTTDSFVILGVANIWDRRKGLDDFIELSKKLTSNEEIVLIGLSNKQRSQLPSNIKGIPRTQNLEELVKLFSEADVFVNPTWEDNFPTTNIEALSCGTPVITYRTGGSIEAIDEATGMVVDVGNIRQLYEAIQCIKRRGKSYYSENCRDRAITLYDSRICYDQYIQLYKKILKY